jgi:CheY-like chemotaxis protein
VKRSATPFSTIALVDDEPSVLLALRLGLEVLGFTVHPFGDADEALDFIRGNDGVDLVVSDLKMPKRSGIEFLERLRGSRPDLPFVLISGHAASDEIQRATALGANGFLPKPFSPDELGDLLERLAARATAVGG